MGELKFDIRMEMGVLSEGAKGWKKEVNLVSWNDRRPKLDIREWDELHDKMGKGITLNRNELKKLKEIINSLEIDSLDVE